HGCLRDPAEHVHADVRLQPGDRLVHAHPGAGVRQPADPAGGPLRRPAAAAAGSGRRLGKEPESGGGRRPGKKPESGGGRRPGKKPESAMPAVHFLDVTNRDGVQTARTGLSKFGKTMVNFYLAKLGVAQSEIGFPFLFHEMPYIRANVALAQAGAFGELRLSGWCRAVVADAERAIPLGLSHYNLSISTSDQMIAHKFRGRLDRAAIIAEMTAAVATVKAAGAQTIGVNAEDGSRTDDGFLLEFALAAKEAGAHRVRYCD